MSNLDKQVLVLNRSWQPINVMTVQKALSMMAADAATAFDFCEDGYFIPVRWQNWLELPVREQDDGIRTPSRVVRVPRVIIAIQFDKVPLKRPRLTLRHFASATITVALTHSGFLSPTNVRWSMLFQSPRAEQPNGKTSSWPTNGLITSGVTAH